MRWLKLMLSIGVSLSLVITLNMKISILPPLGKFLDPFHGFWQNAEIREMSGNQVLQIAGLKEPVSILFDDRLIPHIFADNDHDLYFAQGYVTAKDRLWQMEFQTHAASGRLSEIIGSRTLEYDRFQRRVGMVLGAENALKEMQLDTKNLHAKSVLPALLAMIDNNELSSDESQMFQELISWNFFNDAEKIAPSVFSLWWRKLYRHIWHDEFGNAAENLRFPSKYETVRKIVEEPAAKMKIINV